MERKHTNARYALHDKMDTHLKTIPPRWCPKAYIGAGVVTQSFRWHRHVPFRAGTTRFAMTVNLAGLQPGS